MIEFNKLSKWYGDFRVLTDCTLSVGQGEVVVICGPSGSGKSTLIKCVNALETYQAGSLQVEGVEVGARKTDQRKLRRKVGMVFQNFELYPHLSVRQNLDLAQSKVLGRDRAAAAATSMRLLDRVGMAAHCDRYPGQLSGGQQQRVAIGRALAMDPSAMLFDEPTSALDPEMVREVLDVMTDLASQGMTMLCVTHEMGFARRVAHRVVFMDQGRVIEDAATSRFFDDPQSERARQFLSNILSH
jgi:glutamate/aspartate transport system ATP-binding protein